MRLRPTATLLIAWYALLGTGVVAHLHDLEHDREDAAAAALLGHDHRPHDESNCPTHAQLHFAFTFEPATLPPLDVRPSVAAAPDAGPAAVDTARRSRIRCRGPPLPA